MTNSDGIDPHRFPFDWIPGLETWQDARDAAVAATVTILAIITFTFWSALPLALGLALSVRAMNASGHADKIRRLKPFTLGYAAGCFSCLVQPLLS